MTSDFDAEFINRKNMVGMSNSTNELSVKAIGELLSYHFLIPSYQRGYRWVADIQVKELLEDIWEYQIDYSNAEAFYCLQPVVVKPNVATINGYEIIDGQQRLSTILLILHYFNETEFKTPKKKFDFTFRTRKAQQNFLDKIKDDVNATKNIDLYHLNAAYRFIEKWFLEKESQLPAIKSDFYSKLINKTKVIWYEIKDDSNLNDIFTRLNDGKIPLTNAELIKALFLNKAAEDQRQDNKTLIQLKIGAEWDRIEQTLQKPEFWFFINPETNGYDTRIEFIFDLKKGRKEDDEDFFTFHKFNDEFKERAGEERVAEKMWEEVKNYFLTFEEWFNNQDLYHLIGFLTSYGDSIDDLKTTSKKYSKTNFKEHLKGLCRHKLTIPIEQLNFHEHKKQLRNTLLLFNILSILNNKKSKYRFPFEYYHTQEWDLEHIHSQTEPDIKGKDRKEWAITILKYFTGIVWQDETEQAIQDTLNQLNQQEKETGEVLIQILNDVELSDAEFRSIFERLTKYFKGDEKIDDPDGIGNIALLDQGTNRMYQNAFFPIKRTHIIEQEKKGVFIPLCTKNVFLKAYTQKLGEVMYWKQSDSDDYFNEIKTILLQ